MLASNEKLNILYVGTLPPYPGGSATMNSQLLLRFSELGHSIRALAPITTEAGSVSDIFADRYPQISVTRYLVPYFEVAPSDQTPGEYRRQEGEQIQAKLPDLPRSVLPQPPCSSWD